MQQPIKVLIVDDSPVVRMAIRRLLEEDRTIAVVGAAANGIEALHLIPLTSPDVVVLDVEMPELDGLETLKRIVAQHHCRVVMLSSHTRRGSEVTVAALSEGAFDFVTKPDSRVQMQAVAAELVIKIKQAARAPAASTVTRRPATSHYVCPARGPKAQLVVIGCSTGGPSALRAILPQIPGTLTVPVVVVQHMPMGFTASLAHHLDAVCETRVVHGSDGLVLEPGQVVIAPAGADFLLHKVGNAVKVILKDEHRQLPPGGFRPSVDEVMTEASRVYGRRTLGVLLTGMGRDGAQGMAAIKSKGGRTIAQDRGSCVVFGMPAVAIEMGVVDKVAPLDAIAAEIMAEV